MLQTRSPTCAAAAQEAAKALKRTAGSRSACESGGLDRAFAQLDHALDPARSAAMPTASAPPLAGLALPLICCNRCEAKNICIQGCTPATCSTAQGRLQLLERLVASMQAARLLLVSRRGALPEEPQPQITDSPAERKPSTTPNLCPRACRAAFCPCAPHSWAV